MRVFLSYAHEPPENAAFVDKVRARLEAAHIETWIDTAEIKGGEPWRQAIARGLAACQQTIAFLSAHAVRPNGVCLDELGMALHEHGDIVPVPIEPPAGFPIPHHVSGSQFVDLSDWRGKDDAWLDSKVRELLAVLNNPDAAGRAEQIRVLRRVLDPAPQSAAIGARLEGFVGREWLKAQVDARRTKGQRLIWITGGPGTGKSAFAAWLATWHRSHAIAINLCEMGSAARNTPARVIATIAFQLARRIPDYRTHLLAALDQWHQGASGAIEANLAAIITRLTTTDPNDLFDALLSDPLGRAIDGGQSHDPYLLLLDGLDETGTDDDCPLAELLARHANRMPTWLAIAATSRGTRAIHARFAAVDPLVLDEDAGHIEDLRAYAIGWLRATGQDQHVDAVVTAADGAFLYLTLLRQAVENGWMSLSEPRGLPRGLTGIYRRWFDHLFPDRSAYKTSHRPLLSVLTAASQPVPLALLTDLFGWSAPDRGDAIRKLDRLFLLRDGAIGPFHASLRDWLRREDDYGAGPYLVDEAQGIATLAGALWPRFAAWIADPEHTTLDRFTLTELPGLAPRQPDAALRAALDSAGPWDRLSAAFRTQARAAVQSYAWNLARDWLSLALNAADFRDGDGLRLRHWAAVELGDLEAVTGRAKVALSAFETSRAAAFALTAAAPDDLDRQRELSISHSRIGDLKVDLGDLPGALLAYTASQDIFQRLVEADPSNAGWQRDLSGSYERIGDAKAALGDLSGGLQAYTTCRDIAEALAAADLTNSEWQRNLSVSHNKIGDVKVAHGDLPGALLAYTASEDIFRRLAEADPGNAGWQHDVSVSHIKIGNVTVAQGDLPGALLAYTASLDIRRRLAEADPGNAGWQRDLSVSHEKIGNVKVAQGDLPGALLAYTAGMDIARRLAEADPGNAGWQRDLSVSHNKIGNVKTDQGDLPGALLAYAAGMDIRRRLAEADPGNAGWQRDLSVSHDRIGDVKVAQGDLPGALLAYTAGLDIARRLAEADPGNAGWQRDLSVSHNKIGDVKVAHGDLPGALLAYTASLDIRRRLAEADPGNAGWQRDLSVSHNRIGDVKVAHGDLPGALLAYTASLDIRRRLAEADPGNAGWQRDLSVSHEKIGDVKVAQGDLPGALVAYTASLDIARRLAEADPGNAGWQRYLLVSHEKMGDVRLDEGDAAGALDAYQASLAIAVRLSRLDPGNAGWRRDLAVSHYNVASAKARAGDEAGAVEARRAVLGVLDGMAAAGMHLDPAAAEMRGQLAAAFAGGGASDGPAADGGV